MKRKNKKGVEYRNKNKTYHNKKNRAEIKEKIRNRDELYFNLPERKKLKLRSSSRFFNFLGILFIFITYNNLEKNLNNDFQSYDFLLLWLMWSCNCFLFANIAYLRSLTLPQSKEDKIQFLSRLGRKQAIGRILNVSSLLSFLSLYFAQADILSEYSVFLAVINTSALMYSIFYGIYAFCMLFVINTPKLMLSPIVGVVGSLGVITGYSTFYASPFAIGLAYLIDDISTSMITIITVMITSSFWSYFHSRSSKLNQLQLEALSTIPPQKILSILKSSKQNFGAQYIALKTKLKLEKKLSEAAQVELIKLYLEENKSPHEKYWFLSVIIVLLIFVLQSVGEAFFQDLLYDPFIKPFFCNHLNILCS